MSTKISTEPTSIDASPAPNAPKTPTNEIWDFDRWINASQRWDCCFPNVMQSSGWLQAWWKHMGEKTGQLAVGYSQSQSKELLFPCFVTDTVMGRTLRLLGSGTTCSDYLQSVGGSVASPERTMQVAEAFCQWLGSPGIRKKLGLVDCLELEGYSDQQEETVALVQGMTAAGWNAETVALEGCWVTEFPETWGEYELMLSKSRRRKVRKALKWLEQGRVSFEMANNQKQLDDCWADVVRLHQDRRGMLGQDGCFADKNFQAFLYEAFRGLIDHDRATVALLRDSEHENRVIAVLLLLKQADQWQVYQSGADSSAMDLEPGHTLNALVLHRAFEQGIAKVDFLRGDEPYKQGWAAKRVPLYRTRLFSRHWSARLRFQALRAHREWKRWKGQWSKSFGGGDES